MARNIEIKARVESINALAQIVERLSDGGPREIVQDDTFFRCEQGRLKLRVLPDGGGELIFYQRSNESGPKESFYTRTETADPAGLLETLKLAYGVVGRVLKHREFYCIGRTRVHLDRVEGLGEFLELEVVLADSESAETGIAEAYALLSQLGIARSQLVDRAYIDLLMKTG